MAAATPFDKAQDDKVEFEKYLEESENEQLEMVRFSKGDLLDAVVLDANDRQVFLDIGQKQEGVCSRDEFEGTPEPGMRVTVVVMRGAGLEENTLVSHAEARRREAWNKIIEAHASSVPLTGVVKKELENRKGYIVDYGALDLFLPQSQVSARSRGAHLKSGEKIDFRILEVNDRRKSGIISRRVIQEEQDHEKWDQFTAAHQVGEDLEGEVVRIVSFGIFVRIDGIDGLVHQSDLSWKPNRPFRDLYKKGDKANVRILSIDVENRRLSLGIKQLSEDPWEWARRELHEGDVVEGTVTSITDYGAFVEVREGLEGLIHISELSWLNKLKHPKRYFNPGEKTKVCILTIDHDKRRIALSYRRTRPDPWTQIDSIAKAGDVRQGVVTSITKFGAFVELGEEVEGLIHFKDYSWDDHPDRKMLRKGQTVEFKILDVDRQHHRISCGIKQLTPGPYEALKQKYKKGQSIDGKITNITSFGVFVDIGEGFEGLVHVSHLPLRRDEKIEERYSVGDEVKTVLLKIDADEKRISLSIKDYDRRQQKELMSRYMVPENEGYSFGALLKNNLNQKNYEPDQ
ncbi:MAG: 30S ribosomal protein S1 [Spirochaetae bacterium HGW-Spirochaetae-10]|nr:MAG: 30S ribosomal protein S1 [Spirochaetae bacterium HGW-Spirochaetae-10]